MFNCVKVIQPILVIEGSIKETRVLYSIFIRGKYISLKSKNKLRKNTYPDGQAIG